MAGFANVKEYVDALEEGASMSASIRKVPSQASTAGMFVDLSMAAGNPKPQYYASAPFEAAILDGAEGIFHGYDKSPAQMYVTDLMLTTPTAALTGRYILADYLLYYPFIELDNLDEQLMDNTTTIPRYTDGSGVRVMMIAQAPTAGSEQFTFTYVNQDGVTKTSPVQFCSSSVVNIASVVTCQPATVAGTGAFLTLAAGDTGVRSITSVTVTVGGGGLAALVLVKPLMDHTVFEINTPSEVSCVTMRGAMPRVVDGAYLGLVQHCTGTVAAGQLAGRINYAWG
jgi:hypothetical protein